VIKIDSGILNDNAGDGQAEINLNGSTISAANGVYMNLGNGVFNVNGATVSKLGINTAYADAPAEKLAVIGFTNSVIDLGTGSKSSAIIATKAKEFTIAGESTVVARINGTVTLLDGTTLKDSTFAKYGSKPASTTVVADEAEVTFSGTNTIGKLTVGTDAEITVDGTLTTGTITNNGEITIDGSLSASAISKLGDIVMDATDGTTDTLTVTNAIAGEGTIAITIDNTFEAGTTLITAGSGLLGTTITINGATVAAGDTVLGAYTVVLTDELLTLVNKANTTTLFVDASLTPASAAAAGLAWGVNAFVSFSSAVAGMASDTTTIKVTSSAETTGLTNLTVAPKAAALDIVGATAGVTAEIELGFSTEADGNGLPGDNGLFLGTGVTIGSDVTITTLHNDSHEDNGAVYLNHPGAAGTVTVEGTINSGAAIKIYGETLVNGNLNAGFNSGESFVLFNSGKANVANAAKNATVTIAKAEGEGSAAPTVNATWFLWTSGDIATTDAAITVTGFRFIDSVNAGEPLSDEYFVGGKATLTSKDTTWSVKFVEAADEAITKEAFIDLDGGEFNVTGETGNNGIGAAAQIGDKITINLSNAAKFSVAAGTLENAGTITTDDTATVISAKDIVNATATSLISAGSITATGKIDNMGTIGTGETAPKYGIQLTGNLTAIGAITNGQDTEITEVADKTIIKAANITAASITNYGAIGSQTAELKHTLDKINLSGALTNGKYGNVFANELTAANIVNSNELLVNAITVTGTGTITNNAGAAIALNEGEGYITIDAADGSLTNAGYIKTLSGGSITVNALVNTGAAADNATFTSSKYLGNSTLDNGLIATDSITVVTSITNSGKIVVGSIVAGGTIGNVGTIEAGSVSATYIENSGTFTASGKDNVVSARFNNMAGGSVTLEEGVSLGTADAKVALVGNSKNAAKFEVLNASIYATEVQNLAALTIEGTTATATFNVGTVKNTSTITISGNVALTIGNLATNGSGTYKGITLDGAILTDASVGGANITTVDTDSAFNGKSSFSSLTVDDDATLTINAAAADCLTVTNLNSTGTIYLHAEDDLFAETNLVRVITVGGDFNVGPITTDDGYSVIIQDTTAGTEVYLLNGAPTSMETIVLDITWGNAPEIGEVVTFGGSTHTYGVDAFTYADQLVNLTTDTTTIKFRDSEESYGNLNLSRVNVSGATVVEPLDVTVTRFDGTGVGDTAVFDTTYISTDVNFDVKNIELGALEISGATVTFDETDTKSVTAGAVSIVESEVDFEGNIEIIGDVTIQYSRVNNDEKVKTDITEITGNVIIDNSDFDFDGAATITGNVTTSNSEVEFDRDTLITGALTLDQYSVIEANQGYEFTIAEGFISTINGILIVDNVDDENNADEGYTKADLGTIIGAGTIFTDIYSTLNYEGAGFDGTTVINVSGLKADSDKRFGTKLGEIENPNIVVKGDYVAERTSFKKYFTYDPETGLRQIGRAANVYEATVTTQAQIDAAVTETGWNAAGGNVDPTYFVDNVTLTGDFAYVKTGEGLTSVFLDVNNGQNVILKGNFGTAVYGGEIYGSTTSRAGTWLGGDINVTVDSGTYSRVVVGGDRISVASGRANFFRSTDEDGDYLASINLTINGGLFKSYVAAGVMYEGENLQGSVEVGSTNLEIYGGTFTKDVYGGNYGTKKAASSCTFAESSNVTLTVGGDEKITFQKALFVGSFGSGRLETTTLTLTGVSKVADALTAKEIWGGGSSDYYKETATDRTYETAVSGARTLSFTGFDASVACDRIVGFSDVIVQSNGEELDDDDRVDTNAVLSENVKLSDVSNWTFEAGSTLVGKFENDISGDVLTMDVRTMVGSSWTLFDDTVIDFKDYADGGFDKVRIANYNETTGKIESYSDFTFSDANDAWTYGGYTLATETAEADGKKSMVLTFALA
jgi:hypothetical protein